MRKGVFIPATAVRAAVATVTVAVLAIVVSEIPELRRYLRLRSM